MPKESGKMQSWQVFHYARKHLGNSPLYAIFGKKNARAVDFWAQDPRFTDKADSAYDPIHGIKRLLSMLDDQGHVGVVRACIAYLLEDTSVECGYDATVAELLPTINDEILADYQAVAKMQAAIDAGEHPSVIAEMKNLAVAEIERTYAKYRGEYV